MPMGFNSLFYGMFIEEITEGRKAHRTSTPPPPLSLTTGSATVVYVKSVIISWNSVSKQVCRKSYNSLKPTFQ